LILPPALRRFPPKRDWRNLEVNNLPVNGTGRMGKVWKRFSGFSF
jgi:hypothetical protein